MKRRNSPDLNQTRRGGNERCVGSERKESQIGDYMHKDVVIVGIRINEEADKAVLKMDAAVMYIRKMCRCSQSISGILAQWEK